MFSAICAFAQPVTINPPSATIQPGQSVTLTASGAVYYQWSPATGLSVTEGPVTVASLQIFGVKAPIMWTMMPVCITRISLVKDMATMATL